jgi:hypothetical protein
LRKHLGDFVSHPSVALVENAERISRYYPRGYPEAEIFEKMCHAYPVGSGRWKRLRAAAKSRGFAVNYQRACRE